MLNLLLCYYWPKAAFYTAVESTPILGNCLTGILTVCLWLTNGKRLHTLELTVLSAIKLLFGWRRVERVHFPHRVCCFLRNSFSFQLWLYLFVQMWTLTQLSSKYLWNKCPGFAQIHAFMSHSYLDHADTWIHFCVLVVKFFPMLKVKRDTLVKQAWVVSV